MLPESLVERHAMAEFEKAAVEVEEDILDGLEDLGYIACRLYVYMLLKCASWIF